jgi:hypothetical protein
VVSTGEFCVFVLAYGLIVVVAPSWVLALIGIGVILGALADSAPQEAATP